MKSLLFSSPIQSVNFGVDCGANLAGRDYEVDNLIGAYTDLHEMFPRAQDFIARKVFLEVILQKSTPPQICELILYYPPY